MRAFGDRVGACDRSDVINAVSKESIEPAQGSVCSGTRKIQSMNVLKWLNTKAE